MLLRALIVILAYALSGAGFMSMLVGTLPFLGGEYPLLAKVVPLVWVFAWVAHVRNRSVSRRWPEWGTAAGLFSLASPLLLLLGGEAPSTLDHLQGAFIMIGFASVFFLPSILLAVYLVRFHHQAQG